MIGLLNSAALSHIELHCLSLVSNSRQEPLENNNRGIWIATRYDAQRRNQLDIFIRKIKIIYKINSVSCMAYGLVNLQSILLKQMHS